MKKINKIKKFNLFTISILMFIIILSATTIIGMNQISKDEQKLEITLIENDNNISYLEKILENSIFSNYQMSSLILDGARKDCRGDIIVDKTIKDQENWVSSIQADIDDILEFKITIYYTNNDYDGYMARDIFVADILPSCLEYIAGSGVIYHGIDLISGPSDSWNTSDTILWNLTETYGIKLYDEDFSFINPNNATIYFNAKVIDYTIPSGEKNNVYVDATESCCGIHFEDQTDAKIIVFGRPSIDIEKSTNGEDADDPTGPQLVCGEIVNWTYNITNNGLITLENIYLFDDQLHIAPIFIIKSLKPDQSYLYYEEGIATSGQYNNTAYVNGTSPNGTIVFDFDPSHYIGICHDIEIQKKVSRDNSTWTESINDIIVNCETVYWKITVTNNGPSILNITVTDTETPGEIINNQTLANGNTWTYKYEKTPALGFHENIATVKAYYDNQEVDTDSDEADYTGKEIDIEVTKQVSSDNISFYNSITLPEGDTVYWKIVVTNTGDLPLTVNLSDTEHGIILTNEPITNGATKTIYYEDTALSGTHTNTATVDGKYNDCTTRDTATAEYTGELAGGCTRTYGYWKTHDWDGPAAYDYIWDALDGGMATFLNTNPETSYTEILNTKPSLGNAYIILAHQYIAVELNGIANPQSELPITIQNEFQNATTLLEEYPNMQINKTNILDRIDAIRIALLFNSFNNGNLYEDWPHCDDSLRSWNTIFEDAYSNLLLKILQGIYFK